MLSLIEAHGALTALMDRLPGLRLVNPDIEWRPLVNMRGPELLEVGI